jgi:hypothetical protein
MKESNWRGAHHSSIVGPQKKCKNEAKIIFLERYKNFHLYSVIIIYKDCTLLHGTERTKYATI